VGRRRSSQDPRKFAKTLEAVAELLRQAVKRFVSRHGCVVTAKGDPAKPQQFTKVIERHNVA